MSRDVNVTSALSLAETYMGGKSRDNREALRAAWLMHIYQVTWPTCDKQLWNQHYVVIPMPNYDCVLVYILPKLHQQQQYHDLAAVHIPFQHFWLDEVKNIDCDRYNFLKEEHAKKAQYAPSAIYLPTEISDMIRWTAEKGVNCEVPPTQPLQSWTFQGRDLRDVRHELFQQFCFCGDDDSD